MTRTILVTGSGGSAAHNFVESLRMSPRRYRIVGTDINRYHIHLADLDARHFVPPASDPGYLDALKAVIEEEFVDFVHPQPDPEVLALAGQKLPADTFLPDKQVILRCQDKRGTNEALARARVPAPASWFPADAEDARDIMVSHGSKMWLRATHGAGSKAALPVTKPEQVVGWIEYWQDTHGLDYPDFMLSEYLPGRDFAWTSLWRDGSLVVSQGRERIWYLYGFLSPSGTSSTPSVAVTVNDQKVNDIGTRAVKALDPKPRGLYCVDMKEDAKGEVKVTEVNAGRFFTTSNFYTWAGVNIPYAYVQIGQGFEPPHYDAYDPLPAGLYWLRMVDMQYGLFRKDEAGDMVPIEDISICQRVLPSRSTPPRHRTHMPSRRPPER